MAIPKTVEEVFTKSANTLVRYGWMQGQFGSPYISQGPHCGLGAMRAVCRVDFDESWPEVFEKARDLVNELLPGGIVQFNDYRRQTKAEVVAFLRNAASIAKERGL